MILHVLSSSPSGSIYSKALRVKNLCGYSVGELVNICTNDRQRVFEAALFSRAIYYSVLTLVLVAIVSTLIIGPSALVGCAIFVLVFPLQVSILSDGVMLVHDLTPS